jgi:hypothetical protein
MLFNQKQAFVKFEARAEHESTQAAQKRITVSCLCRLFDRFGQVVDINGARHNMIIMEKGGHSAAL